MTVTVILQCTGKNIFNDIFAKTVTDVRPMLSHQNILGGLPFVVQ